MKNVANANLPLAKYPNWPRRGVIGIDWDMVNEDRKIKLPPNFVTKWEEGYGPENFKKNKKGDIRLFDGKIK